MELNGPVSTLHYKYTNVTINVTLAYIGQIVTFLKIFGHSKEVTIISMEYRRYGVVM